MVFRPMLAVSETPPISWFESRLKEAGYLFASIKIDGFRCLTRENEAQSRRLKPFPNVVTQRILSNPILQGIDAELISGDPRGDDVCRRASSAFMTHEGSPPFTLYAFDLCNPKFHHLPYSERLKILESSFKDKFPNVKVLKQHRITDIAQLETLEAKVLADHFEGLIVRDPRAPYKNGRPTLNEGFMVKIKRFSDSEAKVIGFVEQFANDNPAETNKLGYKTRGSSGALKRPTGTLGSLHVVDIHHPEWEDFHIGSGFDDQTRQEIWDHRDQYLGQISKYKFLKIGVKDRPRHPCHMLFRPKIDLPE